METKTHTGYIAIVGRPNVGKSTLLNRILGQKISITSRKPQTTRQHLLGVKTQNGVQAIYVDTPGIHQVEKRAVNRYMNREASSAIFDVDVIVFVIDSGSWQDNDELVLSKLHETDLPVILAINKSERIKDKKALLPIIDRLKEKMDFTHILPISAKTGLGVDKLEKLISTFLPEGPFLFSEDKKTDRQDEYLIAERIREKIIRNCGQELPYATAVEIEQVKEEEKVLRISALIWVEKPGQKAILIGKKGERLKRIGTDARKEIEAMLKKKIFLQLWVKCKGNWSDNEDMLNRLGL